MKKLLNWLAPFLCVAVLALGLHPQGVAMHFSADAAVGGDVTEYYRFLSLTPVQYGNWGPLLSCALAALLLVMTTLLAAKPERTLRRYCMLVAVAALAASLLSLLFGQMTPVGWAASAALALLLVLLGVQTRPGK